MNNKHKGSTFDEFLDEEGIRDEVEAVAAKRVITYKSKQAHKEKNPREI